MPTAVSILAATLGDAVRNPHAQSVDEILAHLSTAAEGGLDEGEVALRRSSYGPNLLAEAPPVSLWRKVLAQFNELVIWILIAAAVLAAMLGEWVDTIAILAIVVLNSVLSFFQEERAERALAALRKLADPTAKVIRGGMLRLNPARDLVPGDHIELEAGDHVPADARLVRSVGVQVQESALTGESASVEKDARAVLADATSLGDRRNMLYMGTVVAAGRGSAVVTATGMKTELGRIAGMLRQQEPQPTPLQRRLAELGRALVVICLSIVAVVFLLELWRGGKLIEVFLVSVSLAVAAVPEGLPAVVTMTLALGLRRMVKRNALVRKLPSVETLGAVTVICSDKTGTLTRNEMTVRVIEAGGNTYHVTGAGYAPRGEILRVQATGPATSAASMTRPASDPNADLLQALTIAAACNNAGLTAPANGGDDWQITGDPTEAALLVAARKGGVTPDRSVLRVRHEIPFDSERKLMSVALTDSQADDGRAMMYTKGAAEAVLPRCTHERLNGQVLPLTAARRSMLTSRNAVLAADALRVLALAYRPLPAKADDSVVEERDLIFAGLIGMIDPPRAEAVDAVRRAKAAGVRPVMITGDHPSTALAIARELGIANGDARAVTGQELDAMSDAELSRTVEDVGVYARVSAEHKLRVVRAWKQRGAVVAMTGDGVNDAPAVKSADIGIAMGITGTDVTKEASDMVLTDDNFASIVNAIEEGRGIFDNIRKFVHYLLACNAGEVLLMFAAALVGWPVPLTAVQILWINLVTDGLPALALAMEPPESDVMRRPPRPPHEPVLTPVRGLRLLFHGALIAAVGMAGFWFMYRGNPANLAAARTVTFCVVSYAQLLFVLACRSERYVLPQLGLLSNPHVLAAIAASALLQFAVVSIAIVRPVFDAAPHPASEWLLVVLLSLVPVTVVEVSKVLRLRLTRGLAAKE